MNPAYGEGVQSALCPLRVPRRVADRRWKYFDRPIGVSRRHGGADDAPDAETTTVQTLS